MQQKGNKNTNKNSVPKNGYEGKGATRVSNKVNGSMQAPESGNSSPNHQEIPVDVLSYVGFRL